MITSEKANLTGWINHVERLSKSRISICNFEIPNTVEIKTRRKRRRRITQAISKYYVFHANAIKNML